MVVRGCSFNGGIKLNAKRLPSRKIVKHKKILELLTSVFSPEKFHRTEKEEEKKKGEKEKARMKIDS